MKRDGDARPWALIAVKPFSAAKQRLSSLLTSTQRVRFAQAMLHDVLGVLAHSTELAGIVAVASDPDAAMLVRLYGAVHCHDRFDAGTNMAVRQGLSFLEENGGSGAIIVHADAPFLSADELTTAIRWLTKACLVIVPASRDGGVNLLASRLPMPIEPCFGTDSLARHLAAAHIADVEPTILRLDGLGFDIDRADDFALCMKAVSGAQATVPQDAILRHIMSSGSGACTRALISEFLLQDEQIQSVQIASQC